MTAYVDIGKVFFNKGFLSREYVILYLAQSCWLTYRISILYYYIKSYYFYIYNFL